MLELQQGDLACYLTIKERESPLYAAFELCAEEHTGKRVRLHYSQATINDCQSNEPCGRSKRVDMVVRIEPMR